MPTVLSVVAGLLLAAAATAGIVAASSSGPGGSPEPASADAAVLYDTGQ